jgi:hypothetical protein
MDFPFKLVRVLDLGAPNAVELPRLCVDRFEGHLHAFARALNAGVRLIRLHTLVHSSSPKREADDCAKKPDSQAYRNVQESALHRSTNGPSRVAEPQVCETRRPKQGLTVSADREDIRRVVQDFLGLVLHGEPGDVAEQRLAILLDQLALAQHLGASDADPKSYGDPPEWAYGERRTAATRVFPDFGYYNWPELVLKGVGTSKCLVADAIDDVADIAGELAEVEWRWNQTSAADALWHFSYTYRMHWREHLRGLQLYLAARDLEMP